MIEVKNVTKKFGSFTATEDISFNVEEASIYGLVGCNGAGKTTLLKVCAGIYKAESGAVLAGGENVFDNAGVRSRLFFVPDDLYFLPGANLTKMKSFYKGYYPDFSEKVFDNLSELMGLDMKKSLNSFSKGMQRQAEIILALASRPKYMLLDEVFDGIDPQKRSLCKRLFLEYMAETGCSIILSSHNLSEVADLCDRVALINGKRLAMDVSVDDFGEAYKKFRMIFSENVDEPFFKDIPYKRLKVDGRLAEITVSSDFDSSRLSALNPIHTDSINLSLEEVFLNEMEEREYDISKIFSE